MKTKFILTWVFLIASIVVFSQHIKNVLIYNLTSTGCGPCSCMDSTFTHVVWPAHPNTIVVALHYNDSDFHEYSGNCIVDFFRKTSAIEPSCFPDGLGYDVDYIALKDTLDSLYLRSPTTPIDVDIEDKYFDADSRWLDLDIRIRNDGPQLTGNYRYNVMVTEDNILAWHMAWPNCATPHVPPGFDTTFLNRAVTRNILFCANRAPVVEDVHWPEQHEIQFTSKVFIKPEWLAENCQVIVNVYKNNVGDSLYRLPILQAISEPVIENSAIAVGKANNKILKVYPNPAKTNSNLHFSLSSTGMCSLKIFDLKGNMVKNIVQQHMQSGSYKVKLNVENLPAGTYLLVLETEIEKSTEKIIVM